MFLRVEWCAGFVRLPSGYRHRWGARDLAKHWRRERFIFYKHGTLALEVNHRHNYDRRRRINVQTYARTRRSGVNSGCGTLLLVITRFWIRFPAGDGACRWKRMRKKVVFCTLCARSRTPNGRN